MLLITPQEIIECAFLSREKISPASIRAVKIDIAQEHFIRPRFGNSMFDAMISGQYADFVTHYIKPALAHFVRYGVVDELAIQVSDNGVVLYSSTESELIDTSAKKTTAALNSKSTTEGMQTKSVNDTLTNRSEDNKTTNQTMEKTTIKEVSSTNIIENSMGETISSNPFTQNQTTVQTLDATNGSQTDKIDSTTHSESGDKSTSSDVAHFREASPIERRVITQRALSDAKILLAKAVRHVESNGELFDLYIPSNYSNSIFF